MNRAANVNELKPDPQVQVINFNLAAPGFETNEIAVRTKRVDGVSVNSWCGAGLRIRRVLLRVADVADARGPDWFTVLS